MQPIRHYPGYSLRRAAHVVGTELSARLAAHNLRMVDSTVLLVVGENPGVTASAIGRALDIQRANMVPLINRLEAANLIDRVPIDRKSQGLQLTEHGRRVHDQALETVRDYEAELIARVPEEHRPHLLPALDSLWR